MLKIGFSDLGLLNLNYDFNYSKLFVCSIFWNEQHQSRDCSFLDYELVQHEERFSHNTKCDTKCFIVGETDEIGEAA